MTPMKGNAMLTIIDFLNRIGDATKIFTLAIFDGEAAMYEATAD